MKLKKCTVCGKDFISERGIEVCSKECRAERKHRQDVESNRRRYSKESGEPKNYICKYCGKEFEGIARRYCSKECREMARKLQIKENNKIYYNENKERKERKQ